GLGTAPASFRRGAVWAVGFPVTRVHPPIRALGENTGRSHGATETPCRGYGRAGVGDGGRAAGTPHGLTPFRSKAGRSHPGRPPHRTQRTPGPPERPGEPGPLVNVDAPNRTVVAAPAAVPRHAATSTRRRPRPGPPGPLPATSPRPGSGRRTAAAALPTS